MTEKGENHPLLALVVKALEPYDIPTDRWSQKDREEPARAVLDALGLEEVGHGWCPIHGDASCPEQYMLLSDGHRVAPGYAKHWDESLRCGQRQPTYRLSAVGSKEAGS